MSMQAVRDHYQVPAKQRMRVEHDGRPGVIVKPVQILSGAGGWLLQVRFDDDPDGWHTADPNALTYPSDVRA